MSIDRINKNLLLINTISNINSNLGIDSNSLSSKTKMLSDAFVEEVVTCSANTEEVLSRIYTSSATGKYLDLNGAEWNVFRNHFPYVTIDGDATSYISPLNATDGFDDLIIGRQIIEVGERFEIDSKYIVTFLSPVIIASKYDDVEISVRIEAADGMTSVNINKNTRFELYNNSNPYLDYISLKITNTINIPIEPMDDDRFRYVIEQEKLNVNVSSQQAIANAIRPIRFVNGYHVVENEIGTGIVTTYIVFDEDVLLGSNSRFISMAKYMSARLASETPGGVIHNIVQPYKNQLKISYTNTESVMSPDIIKEAILEIIYQNYRYSKTQLITVDSLNRVLIASYRALSGVVITGIDLFDPNINDYIYRDVLSIELDHKTYISISKTDIYTEMYYQENIPS